MDISDAYTREMYLLPVVISMEHRGIRVNPEVLQMQMYWADKLNTYNKLLAKISGAEPGTKAMFNALRAKGYIDESKLQYTDKGNVRYGREFLETYIVDETLLTALKARSKLQKALGTYINPFAESAVKYNGRYYPYFNQTRSLDDRGTSTGRFSSNIQQMPKTPEEGEDLPNLRTLIYPEEGHVLIKRDFDGQELRVAAHYAEGSILEAYRNNPKLPVHEFVRQMIEDTTGVKLVRRTAKTMNFLKLYGGSARLLAEKLDIPERDAYALFNAYDKAFPEFKQLSKACEQQVRRGIKLRTWGGRLYDVEPPSRNKYGKMTENYYKLANLLIQGSSADMTKEAMVRYYYHPARRGYLIMQVHDELVVSAPEDKWEEEMDLLKWAMDDIPGWDVPLSSDGSYGPNFGEVVKYEDRV